MLITSSTNTQKYFLSFNYHLTLGNFLQFDEWGKTKVTPNCLKVWNELVNITASPLIFSMHVVIKLFLITRISNPAPLAITPCERGMLMNHFKQFMKIKENSWQEKTGCEKWTLTRSIEVRFGLTVGQIGTKWNKSVTF